MLRIYKAAISPMLPPSCRYTPTCSEYAAEAIDRFGVFRGALTGIWRLLRCHPFAKGGFDPVPNGDCGAGFRQTLRLRSGQTRDGARLHMSGATSQHH